MPGTGEYIFICLAAARLVVSTQVCAPHVRCENLITLVSRSVAHKSSDLCAFVFGLPPV